MSQLNTPGKLMINAMKGYILIQTTTFFLTLNKKFLVCKIKVCVRSSWVMWNQFWLLLWEPEKPTQTESSQQTWGLILHLVIHVPLNQIAGEPNH